MKNVLTKALGVRPEVEFDVAAHDLLGGDIVLLCSDRLTNMLDDQAILEIVARRQAPREDLRRARRQRQRPGRSRQRQRPLAAVPRMIQKIGKYRIIERIGRGGMGSVYRRTTRARPLVALKVVSAETDHTEELRARFFREAQACAKLSHPNVVTIPTSARPTVTSSS
jgi:hypothetical protein